MSHGDEIPSFQPEAEEYQGCAALEELEDSETAKQPVLSQQHPFPLSVYDTMLSRFFPYLSVSTLLSCT